MLVPEIIQQAVAGVLTFNFIESTITASRSGTLSSQKGTGKSEARQGRFRYIFHPRTALRPAWIEPDGYLDSGAGKLEFSIKGTERGGAQWFAKVPSLRQVQDVPGKLVIEADVDEWCCADSRSVSTSFVRGIVPGTGFYPAESRRGGGVRGDGASILVRNIVVEFRDYGRYTEVFAQNSATALPADFVDSVVSALGSVTGKSLQLVYKEEHVANQRRMSVRGLRDSVAPAATHVDDTEGFWNRYREQLLMQLESSATSSVHS